MIVHLVTDRRRLAPGLPRKDALDCLLAQAQHAVLGRVDVIQVREPDLAVRHLAEVVMRLVELTRGTGTRVVVNDRVDVALACGADGVHLRADSVRTQLVRTMTPAGFLIGRSVHRSEEAASEPVADYLIAGTVWRSESKGPAATLLGIDGLRAIVSRARAPVLAIGGVTLERAAEIADAGAAGVAAIGLFMDTGGNGRCRCAALDRRVGELRQRFDRA